MSASVRSQIIDAALVLLNTSRPGGVPQFDDERQEPYAPVELPSALLYELREQGETEQEGRWGYFVKRTFTLRIEIRVAGDAARAAIDPILVWCGQQLGAQQFTTSGGVNLAEDCYEAQTEWQRAAEDQPYTLIQIDFRIIYSTRKNDPTLTQ